MALNSWLATAAAWALASKVLLMADPPRHIVLIRLGAVGDVVLTLGVAASIRAALPTSRITLVTRPALVSLVCNHPALSGVMTTTPEQSLRELSRMLHALRPDVVVDLHGKLRGFFLWALPGSRKHVVWRGRPFAERLRHRLGGGRAHATAWQTERYFQAAERALRCSLSRFKSVIVTGDHDDRDAFEAWAEVRHIRAGRPVVVLSPGAQWMTKRWPIRHYRTLIGKLLASEIGVVVVGSRSEAPLADAVCRFFPRATNLAGRLSLGPLAAFLRRADLLITGDSGPMHIARAVSCPALALFGSTSPRAFDVGQDAFLSEDLDCAPCSFFGRSGCPLGTLACLEDLAPERVFSTARVMLRAKLLA